jgi:hypothetical protein
MLSHTKYLTVKVPDRMDFVNITGEVEKAVKESRSTPRSLNADAHNVGPGPDRLRQVRSGRGESAGHALGHHAR